MHDLQPNSSLDDSTQLVEDYFERLLAWNQETGWDTMIEISIWRTPIYDGGGGYGNDMPLATLKEVLAQGAPYTSYEKIDNFFSGIAGRLSPKYGKDSVNVGCVEPFKLAVIQGGYWP